MNFTKLLQILRGNISLVLASLFFIAWKFFFIHILWRGRSLAPEPDDSYTYIAHIRSVLECPSLLFCENDHISLHTGSGYIYLSYRIIFGVLGKFFHFSPESIYHISFYAGTLLLLAVLIPFLRTLTKDKALVAYSLFFLALFHGMGEIHGFYWVVPSFFSTCFFFLIATFLLSKRDLPTWPFLLMAVFYTYLHPMSVYLIFIFPLYSFIHFILTRQINWRSWRKTILIVATVLLSSYSQTFYLSQVKGEAYYSPNKSIRESQKIVEALVENKTPHIEMTYYNVTPLKNNNFFDRKILSLHSVYFKWLLPHWLCLIPFLIILFTLLAKREFSILSFYFAALLFFILSTFLNEYGFRSAIILWPVTYLVFAFGSWHLFQILRTSKNTYIKTLVPSVFIIAIVFFVAINFLYALTVNYNLNIRNTYSVPEELRSYFRNNVPSGSSLNLTDTLARTEIGSDLLEQYHFSSLENAPEYIVLIDESRLLRPNQPLIENTLNQLSLFLRHRPLELPSFPPLRTPSGYILIEHFGALSLFKKAPDSL